MACLRFLDRLTLRETRRCNRLSFCSALLRLARVVYVLALSLPFNQQQETSIQKNVGEIRTILDFSLLTRST
jgi:hypothetical protein